MADANRKKLQELRRQLARVFDRSPQGVYLYLDDHHTSFSKRLAKMLGYKTPRQVEAIGSYGFLQSLVAPKSRRAVVNAYQHAALANVASTVKVSLLKKNGKSFATSVTFVPLPYKGEHFVLHFIK